MNATTGKKAPCPICGRECRFWPDDPNIVACDVCGQYRIAFELEVDQEFKDGPHPYLSAATRKAHAAGHPLVLKLDNWKEHADAQRAIRVTEKLDHLLRLIAGVGAPGRAYRFNPSIDYPLIAARDGAELVSYLEYLEQKGLVSPHTRTGDGGWICVLTVPGWQRLEPMPQVGGIPGRCFIAMSFDASLDSAWELGIKPAILECGFRPICMREIATNEGITDRILSEIRIAQFVVADFTGQRGGVYFEAGFARGLGREVIWACRKDELRLVHFDIKHFGHVVWETPTDFREKLSESVRANIIPKQ